MKGAVIIDGVVFTDLVTPEKIKGIVGVERRLLLLGAAAAKKERSGGKGCNYKEIIRLTTLNNHSPIPVGFKMG